MNKLFTPEQLANIEKFSDELLAADKGGNSALDVKRLLRDREAICERLEEITAEPALCINESEAQVQSYYCEKINALLSELRGGK